MNFWTPEHLQQLTGGRWLAPPPDPALPLTGLGIDSRAVQPGQVFLAIKGDRFDGHDFVDAALRAGAAMAIVSSARAANQHHPAGTVLLVRDTLAALHALAAAWRAELATAGVKVIAVGGSNGKTTTRHLIHTVLSRRLTGTQSPQSFNNHIGVPLTLLAASLEHDFVVAELGTNHPGEIAALASLVRPDAAVITSIGEEHLEFFGSVRGVAEEEATLFEHVKPGGVAMMSRQVAEMIGPAPKLPAKVSLTIYGDDARPLTNVRLPLPGAHNLQNALAAMAVGRWFGLTDGDALAALADAQPVPMRTQLLRLGDASDPAGQLLLIHDAYNANPQSVRAALAMLAEVTPPGPTGRRVAILGDMLELGAQAADLHRAIGRLLGTGIDVCVTIGALAGGIAETADITAHRFEAWTDALPPQVAALLEPGDAVLLKASRGLKLERLIPAIEARMRRGAVCAAAAATT